MPVADFFLIKREVRDIVSNSLPDFTVTWGFTQRDVPRLWAYIGRLHWPDADWVTNRRREYVVTLPIILNAIKARTTPEDAEEYLAERVNALTAAFDENSSLRNAGAISWTLAPRDFGSQPHTDGIEIQAALELQVTYRP